MGKRWKGNLRDSITALLATKNEAVVYFTRRDLLGEEVDPIQVMWELKESQKILKKQSTDGSWTVPISKKPIYPENHAQLVATFKAFRTLVERYQFTRESVPVEKAAEYIFSFQTHEGDIRGFIGNQYATYYTGYILALLIQAGYVDDPRVEKGIQWLLKMRQDDGGWTIPILTHHFDRNTIYSLTSSYAEPIEPDRRKPFSHNWTNMILQAFAAHPVYRKSEEAKAARNHLKSKDRIRGRALWEKYFGLHFKPNVVRCERCQSLAPWKTGNLLPDRACPIRACAVHNEVATCAYCSLFPCVEYSKRVPSSKLRQQREKATNITFTDDEYQKYIEPFEGQVHLKELHNTIKPEEIVPSKEVSYKVVVVPFPIKTGLTTNKQEEMRLLHSLLENVYSEKAVNYIDQLLFERKKPYLWVLIWVMGLYGEVRGETLVLESTAHRDRIECSRLVRKKDNTLYEPVQEGVNRLKKWGIRIEFKPSKKNWTMILRVDESTVGPVILTALRAYVLSLVAKYGEPVYAGSYKLDGKAFKLFTKADMNNL